VSWYEAAAVGGDGGGSETIPRQYICRARGGCSAWEQMVAQNATVCKQVWILQGSLEDTGGGPFEA